MANLTVNLPAPAGDGVGASQNTAALGGRRTITVQGTFRGTVIIEVSEDAGSTFAPIAAFTNGDERVIDFAANSMRVRRVGVPGIDPGTPVVDVAAADGAGVYTTLPVTAGNGTGASVNTVLLPGFKTVTVLGTYTGTVLVQISEDNVVFSTAFAFTPGDVIQSQSITAAFMRAVRSGVKESAGTPVVAVGAVPDSSGGGGGSSYTLDTIEVDATSNVSANLPDGATLDENDEVNVKNITQTTGTITVSPAVGQTIDGAASFTMEGPLISARFNWDGVSNWRVV